MKILTDFDGVLTHPSDEVEDLFRKFEAEVLANHPMPPEKWQARLQSARQQILDEPHLHGWEFDGRISAFGNEDGFLNVNAIARLLDSSQWVEKAFQNTNPLHSAVDRSAIDTLLKAIDLGHEVVIVSNSNPIRIQKILTQYFGPAGIPPSIRLRGSARKFELGQPPRPLNIQTSHGHYVVETQRPCYEAVFKEEKPDIVVGDVFSLDLSLPLTLWRDSRNKSSGSKFGTLSRLYLRAQSYTPQWSLEYVEKNADTTPLRVLRNFEDLLESF